jgi:glycine/D-amino acid oxidase-like deaminating enzyme
MDVVVVGAGVIGASVAYHLAARGARTTVIEGKRPIAGTSGTTFAWTNANGKSPAGYYQLNLAGMREHVALADQLGGAWNHPDGLIECPAPGQAAEDLRKRMEQLGTAGYNVRALAGSDLQVMEPDLALPDVEPVALYPDEGWVDTAAYVATLLGAARDHGAYLVAGRTVSALDSGGGRLTAVAGAERFEADVLVSCVGPDGASFAAMADVTLPMRPSLGLLAVTAPVAARLGRVVRGPGVDMRPDGGGRLMLSAGGADQLPAEVAADPEAIRERADRLAAAASAMLPVAHGVVVESLRVGRRAIPADGLPAVGPMGGDGRLYHVITHSGVTLAPILGRLVAGEIVTGNPADELEPYRPGRLCG